MTMTSETLTGTKEWACTNVNFLVGCRNDCRYCFARHMAVTRFHRCVDWTQMVVNERAVNKGFNKRAGKIMFPSTHDLFPEHLPVILKLLRRMLIAGNSVLIVSKPRLDVITAICHAAKNWFFKPPEMEFRFTIGSRDSAILRKYEPGAPSYEERLACLRHTYNEGFATSVSIEPYLDYDLFCLVTELVGYVTGEIWIGCMNYDVPEELKPLYTRENARQIFEDAYHDPFPGFTQLRWKNSFRELRICDSLGRML